MYVGELGLREECNLLSQWKCLINCFWKHNSNSLYKSMMKTWYFRIQKWLILSTDRDETSHHTYKMTVFFLFYVIVHRCLLWTMWVQLIMWAMARPGAGILTMLLLLCSEFSEISSGGLVLSKKWSNHIKGKESALNLSLIFFESVRLSDVYMYIYVCMLKWNNKKSKQGVVCKLQNVCFWLDCLRYWKFQTSFAFYFSLKGLI